MVAVQHPTLRQSAPERRQLQPGSGPLCRGWDKRSPSCCLLGFPSRVCCWIWGFMVRSVPGTVGTGVSDRWCVAISETSDSQSFLEQSRVCRGEQSCSLAVSQGRSSPGERCPQGTSSEPGPYLLLGPLQSFPVQWQTPFSAG